MNIPIASHACTRRREHERRIHAEQPSRNFDGRLLKPQRHDERRDSDYCLLRVHRASAVELRDREFGRPHRILSDSSTDEQTLK
jgi:hypothetical protein